MIDPSIPLHVKPFQLDTPFQQIGRAMQLRGMAQDHEVRQGEIDRQRQVSKNEAALHKLLSSGQVTPEGIYKIVGPERGAAIVRGIAALEELKGRRVADARENAGRLAMGLRALPEGMRANAWPQIRQLAIEGGLDKPENLPEQVTPEYLDSVIAWSTGREKPVARVTFSRPEKYTVNGKRVFAMQGSDGQLYDMMRRPIPAEQIEVNDNDVLAGGDSDYTRYLVRAARDRGKTVDQLTAREEEDLRTTFYATSRAPERAGGGQRSPSNRNPRGSSAIPQGVETYILSMRNRGYTQSEALAEFLGPQVWANMQRDHPTMTAERAREAITRLIPEEGAPPLQESAPTVVTPGSEAIQGATARGGSGIRVAPEGAGGRGAGSGQAPNRGTMTLAELRTMAEAFKITEAEARRIYEARGFTIR